MAMIVETRRDVPYLEVIPVVEPLDPRIVDAVKAEIRSLSMMIAAKRKLIGDVRTCKNCGHTID